MSYLIDLQPSAGRVLVIGGGRVATRKVRGLVAGGLAVTVVAPEVADAICALPGVEVRREVFAEACLDGHILVFACTDSRETNRWAGAVARAARIPVVVADSRAESTFFTPAVHRDGALAVGVSTGGASPALAAAVRDQLAASLGPGWAGRVQAAAVTRAAGPADGDG